MYMYVPVQIQIEVPLSFGGYRKNLCISHTFLPKFWVIYITYNTYIHMYFEYRYTTVFYELIHVPDCRFNLWNNKTLKLVLKLLRGKVNICKHAAFLENMHLPFALSFGLEYWPDSSTCSKCHWKCGMCERNIGGWSRLWCFG